MSNIYFGGSRHPQNINHSQIAAVVAAVVASGQAVHVGCQAGADQAVIQTAINTFYPSLLSVFLVAAHHSQAPSHTMHAAAKGARVTFAAGGTTAPMKARFLLRSIAAFQGCSTAVFFQPGAGSLAVARECVRSGLSVFAFSQTIPAPIPSTFGNWVSGEFFGFSCYGFYYPNQPQLF